jgi:hypothetical protein
VSRQYTFEADAIDCRVSLTESDYGRVMSIWLPATMWSQVKSAYEMIPFMASSKGQPMATATLTDAAGNDTAAVTAEGAEAAGIRIERDGYGVNVKLDQPRIVKLGANNTVLIQIVADDGTPAPADEVKLQYRLTPFVR